VLRSCRLAPFTAGMVIVLAACAPLVEMPAPSADGPWISHLQFDPPETVAGCTVTMRFHFDAKGAEITSGLVRWSVAVGKRLNIDGVTLREDLSAGRVSGEVTTPLKISRPGYYRYRVQVEDIAGRRSNVLEGDLRVEVPWAWWVTACAGSQWSQGLGLVDVVG